VSDDGHDTARTEFVNLGVEGMRPAVVRELEQDVTEAEAREVLLAGGLPGRR
jgi:hypothetical protein